MSSRKRNSIFVPLCVCCKSQNLRWIILNFISFLKKIFQINYLLPLSHQINKELLINYFLHFPTEQDDDDDDDEEEKYEINYFIIEQYHRYPILAALLLLSQEVLIEFQFYFFFVAENN